MLRLEHVCVRWSLSVCVGCVSVCERERREIWSLSLCVCVRERDGVLVCVCVWGVRACACVCVCVGVSRGPLWRM